MKPLSQTRQAIVEEYFEITNKLSDNDLWTFCRGESFSKWLTQALNDYNEKVTEAVKDWYTLPPKYRTKARLLEELRK